MIEVVRWTTIHPALAHLPLGLLPLAVLSYSLAAWRRSERWTFVGDVSSFGAAGSLVLVVIFGVVSYLLVPQPAILGRWPLLHAAAGASTAVLMLMFALARVLHPPPRPLASRATAVAILVVALGAVFTGWVGGEVLVFRGGMAVEAAGNVSLVPASRSSASRGNAGNQSGSEVNH